MAFLESAALLLLSLLARATAGTGSTAASCPLDFRYVGTFPWDYTCCLPNNNGKNHTCCCQTLLSLVGIAFSENLKRTSHFRLPDAATSTACLADYQSNLTASISLPSTVVLSCFPNPERFVIKNDSCAGIQTLQDWTRTLGSTIQLNKSCKSSLSGTLCNACNTAGFQTVSQLIQIDGNASHSRDCFYFVCTYIAGVVNELGPRDPDTATCSFRLPLLPPEANKPHSRVGEIRRFTIGAVLTTLALLGVVLVVVLEVKRWRRGAICRAGASDLAVLHRPNTGALWYTIDDLERATGGFSKLIGRGGYGMVYKGVLTDGTAVAVKRLEETDLEGEAELRNEVDIVGNLRHRNLVPLRGVCITDRHNSCDDDEATGGREWYLIYDYMPNGSLDDHLFNSNKNPLTWAQRKNIILDVARGLAYLHHAVKPAIIQRDTKAPNILLDTEMRAAVADFGLAKQSREGTSYLTSRVAGTQGYVAPEYALYGQLTGKSDVYSFGVLLLEVMSGRRALEVPSGSNAVIITDWAWAMVKAGRVGEVIDGSMAKPEDEGEMERFVMVGILCAHLVVAMRPTMAEALRMLEGDVGVPAIPERPLPPGVHQETLDSIDMG